MPAYEELIGDLEPFDGAPTTPVSKAVYSDLARGSAVSGGADGVWVKYVARGSVAHTFGSRTYVARAGEFLFAPERKTSEVEVRPLSEPSTIGLCLFVANPVPGGAVPAEEPIVFPARCSALGRLVAAETARMRRVSHDRVSRGAALVQAVEPAFETFLADAARQFEALPDLRSATRHETLRRLQRARAHLYDVSDRAVELPELAQVAGLSRFQLLRQFKLVFGDTPSAYHRRLRLQLAAEAVRRRGEPVALAAERHGFADGSSFSHAYRRAFGEAPFRPRRAA